MPKIDSQVDTGVPRARVEMELDPTAGPLSTSATLGEVTTALVSIERTWRVAVALAGYWEAGQLGLLPELDRLDPPLVRLTKQSPLWVEFAGPVLHTAVGTGMAYAIFATLMKAGPRAARFVQHCIASWHSGWAEVADARTIRETSELRNQLARDQAATSLAYWIDGPNIGALHILQVRGRYGIQTPEPEEETRRPMEALLDAAETNVRAAAAERGRQNFYVQVSGEETDWAPPH